MQILSIVLPVFLIILAGFLASKIKIIKPSHLDSLNDFAYYIALPALIIASFWQIDFLQKALAQIIGYNLLTLILFALLLAIGLSLFNLPNKTKAALFLSSLVGNTIYMGFPIGRQGFGEPSFPLVAGAGSVHLILGTFLGIMAAIHWTKRHENLKLYLKEFFTNPLILALIAGVILSFLPAFGQTEDILKKTFSMLGATASPVALFALGCFLSLQSQNNPLALRAVPVVLKLLVFPLLVFIIFKKFGLPANQTNVSVLVAAMPSAVTSFVIAEKFGLDEKLVADSLIITTALSVISLTFILYFTI